MDQEESQLFSPNLESQLTDDHRAHIIIPTYNRKKITLKCLKRLEDLGYIEDYCVVVVDDASADGTSEAIIKTHPNVTVIGGNGNLWWTGAISVGMEYAFERGAAHFIWLNDDCLVEAGTFEYLLSFCQNHENCIVGVQGYEAEHPHDLAFGGKVTHWSFALNYELKEFLPNEVLECDMLSGNLVCLPRSVVSSCGYPNAQEFPHYGGDTIYLQTAQSKKFRMFVDTRKSAMNILPSASSSNVSNWFTAKGSALMIVQLLSSSQSSLYWKLFLNLNTKQFGNKGYFLFILKYAPILGRVFVITILRFLLPYHLRIKLSEIKHRFGSTPPVLRRDSSSSNGA